jgi:membrane protease YdiL (CAAX protease family)
MEEPEGFEARPMSPFAAIAWTLGVTFLWLILAQALGSIRGSADDEIDLVTNGGCQAAAYLLGLFGILRIHAPDASIRKFVAVRKTHVLFFVAAPLLAVTVKAFTDVAYDAIVRKFPLDHEGAVESLILEASFAKRIALFAVVVVIGPIVEELLFRGAIVQGLRKTQPLTVVATISSAVFALAHTQWQAFVPLAACGAALVALRLASGSLLPGLLMHATYNLIAFVEVLRSPAHGDDETTKYWLPLLALGIVGTGVLLWLVRAISNTDAARSARQLDEAA